MYVSISVFQQQAARIVSCSNINFFQWHNLESDKLVCSSNADPGTVSETMSIESAYVVAKSLINHQICGFTIGITQSA